MEKLNNAFVTRHSIKPAGEDGESAEYKGISDKGVEAAEVRAEGLKNIIDEAESGSVIFIGGASDAIRTKSTANVYGNKLNDIYHDEPAVKVFAQSELNSIQDGGGKTIKVIGDYIKEHSGQKVVISSPLFLKELSLKDWMTKEGDLIPYFKTLYEQNDNNDLAVAREWISNQGKVGELSGPNPVEVAKGYIKAIKRLQEFVKGQVGDRPVIVGLVGHCFVLDVLATYLANDGAVTVEGFDKVSKSEGLIKETEPIQIEINSTGASVVYRRECYPIITQE